MIKIADMLTHECLTIHHECDRILQVRPQSEYWILRRKSCDSSRRISARAPQYDRPIRTIGCDRIVDSTRDRPFSHQEGICDSREPFDGFRISISDRLAGSVCTRHDESLWRTAREQ